MPETIEEYLKEKESPQESVEDYLLTKKWKEQLKKEQEEEHEQRGILAAQGRAALAEYGEAETAQAYAEGFKGSATYPVLNVVDKVFNAPWRVVAYLRETAKETADAVEQDLIDERIRQGKPMPSFLERMQARILGYMPKAFEGVEKEPLESIIKSSLELGEAIIGKTESASMSEIITEKFGKPTGFWGKVAVFVIGLAIDISSDPLTLGAKPISEVTRGLVSEVKPLLRKGVKDAVLKDKLIDLAALHTAAENLKNTEVLAEINKNLANLSKKEQSVVMQGIEELRKVPMPEDIALAVKNMQKLQTEKTAREIGAKLLTEEKTQGFIKKITPTELKPVQTFEDVEGKFIKQPVATKTGTVEYGEKLIKRDVVASPNGDIIIKEGNKVNLEATKIINGLKSDYETQVLINEAFGGVPMEVSAPIVKKTIVPTVTIEAKMRKLGINPESIEKVWIPDSSSYAMKFVPRTEGLQPIHVPHVVEEAFMDKAVRFIRQKSPFTHVRERVKELGRERTIYAGQNLLIEMSNKIVKRSNMAKFDRMIKEGKLVLDKEGGQYFMKVPVNKSFGSKRMLAQIDKLMQRHVGKPFNPAIDMWRLRDMEIVGSKGRVALKYGDVAEINTALQQVGAKWQFSERILDIMRYDMIRSNKAVYSARYLADAEKMGVKYGWIKGIGEGGIDKGWSKIENLPDSLGLFKNMQVRSDFLPYLKKSAEFLSTKPSSKTIKTIRDIISVYKGFILANPDTIATNLFGNTSNLWMKDIFHPRDMYIANKMRRAVKQFSKTHNFNAFDDITITAFNGKTATGREFFNEAVKAGVYDTHRQIVEAATSGGLAKKILDKTPIVSQLLKAFGATEEFSKYMGAIRAFKKTGNLKQAFEMANEALFDYAHLEKGLIARNLPGGMKIAQGVEFARRSGIAPFLAWTYFELPFLLKHMVTKPHKFAQIALATRNYQDVNDKIAEEWLPEKITNRYGILHRFDKEGNASFYILDNWLTVSEVLNIFTNPKQYALNKINSVLKIPPELLTGRDIDTGYDLDNMYYTPFEPLGFTMEMPWWMAHILRNMPVLGYLDRNVVGARREALKDILFGKITGLKTKTVNIYEEKAKEEKNKWWEQRESKRGLRRIMKMEPEEQKRHQRERGRLEESLSGE